MKILLMLILLCISTFAWSAGVDTRWQFDEYDGMISEAWTPEMKGNFLAFSFSCNNKENNCGFYLSLPINCDKVAGMVVEVPIKLGKTTDVAHMKCLGTGGWMQYSQRGLVGVYNMGKLSKDGDPVRVDLYNWSVKLQKYSDQIVPDMDDEKTITFIFGQSEYTFNLHRSNKAFQKVYKTAMEGK